MRSVIRGEQKQVFAYPIRSFLVPGTFVYILVDTRDRPLIHTINTSSTILVPPTKTTPWLRTANAHGADT